jgi:hypothetical protein
VDRTGFAIALALVLSAGACGSGYDDGATPDAAAAPAGESGESSPFTVGREPDGYRLVQAGRGGIDQTWSSDSSGDDEPVTVLAPVGAPPDGEDEVRVSLTGYAGFQGGLDQAATGYPAADGEHFEVDGRPAIYTPGGVEDGRQVRADLVVAVGDDLAVRVAAFGADRDELVDVARQVEPHGDHLLAPLVADPPGDLEMVGAADADVGITLVHPALPGTDDLPAGTRAYSAVWAMGEPGTPWGPGTSTVAVSTLPGIALHLAALGDSLHRVAPDEPEVTPLEVAGRPGAVLDLLLYDELPLRAIATSTPAGDVLLVVARGEEQPSLDELAAVAASVEPATSAEWDALVERAAGGPGLHPDEGAVELARGSAGDVEWLLQARVDDGTIVDFDLDPVEPSGEYVADPCLKLATGERSCPTSSSGNGDGSVFSASARPLDLEDGGTFPGFVVVMTTLPATTLRIPAGDGGTTDVALVPLPGGRRSAAVVVGGDEPGLDLPCGDAASPRAFELLDAAGRPVPC